MPDQPTDQDMERTAREMERELDEVSEHLDEARAKAPDARIDKDVDPGGSGGGDEQDG